MLKMPLRCNHCLQAIECQTMDYKFNKKACFLVAKNHIKIHELKKIKFFNVNKSMRMSIKLTFSSNTCNALVPAAYKLD
jgi:hypothetical protein